MKIYTILLTLLLTACSGESVDFSREGKNIMINGDSFEFWSRGNWPSMLDEMTEENILNFSKGGRTLEQMAELFVSDYMSIGNTPITVGFAGGINDVVRVENLERMQISLMSMIEVLPEETSVIVFDIPPFSSASYWTESKQKVADDFTNWIHELTKIRPNTKVFSYRKVLDTNGDGVLDPEFDNGDGLHPNTELGQPAIVEAFYKFLNSSISKPHSI